VLHPGSSLGTERDAAVKRVGQALAEALAQVSSGPALLVENTAGGGSQLGAESGELAAIAAACGAPERVGVCLDTAHACAAGHDVVTPAGLRRLLAGFRRAFGRLPIRLLHANDLRAEPGARHDRHEHIGRGAIGDDGFRALLRAAGLRRLPAILETPVEKDGDDRRNLARARRLAHATG